MVRYFLQSINRNAFLRILMILVVYVSMTQVSAQVLPQYLDLTSQLVKPIELDYLLYTPPHYRPSETYPLIVYLTGEEAIDDINQIRNYGVPKELELGMDHDFFVVAPQLPGDVHWDPDAIIALIQDLESRYHIDDAAISITGIGDRGGWGAYETATSYPNTFMKLAPMGATAMTEICRMGDNVSTWIFHGVQDSLVPIADAENMAYEIESYCGSEIQLTTYDSLGHNVWDAAYNEAGFWQWLTGTTPNYGSSPAQPQILHFSYTVTKNFTDNYLLYLPENYDSGNSDWPMVIFLHGSGGPISNIDDIRTTGPPYYFEHGMDSDFVLLCPQLYGDVHWDVDRLHKLTLEILANYRIDESRIYITGLSRGGAGTWEYAVSYPEMFAAVVPISARDIPGVERLVDTNTWIFHGGADTGVPFQGAQWMYNRLSTIGANVQLTMYPGMGHIAWQPAYATDSLWTWMLAQQSNFTGVADEPSNQISDFDVIDNYPNPFNPVTTIRYKLPESMMVRVTIYNQMGQELRRLVNQSQLPGTQSIFWDSRDDAGKIMSSGIYFVRIETDKFEKSRKMLLLK